MAPDYLSRSWDFPHPYSHTGYRYLEQAAERVADDGVTFLATGREGDILFGPLHYSVRDILFGDLCWREKQEMMWVTGLALATAADSQELYI